MDNRGKRLPSFLQGGLKEFLAVGIGCLIMQDKWQVQVIGKLQVQTKSQALHIQWSLSLHKINASLSKSDDLRGTVCQDLQALLIFGRDGPESFVQKGRVQANSSVDARMKTGELDGALGRIQVYPDGEEARDVGLTGAPEQRGSFLIAIAIKMYMAVSEHSQSLARIAESVTRR